MIIINFFQLASSQVHNQNGSPKPNWKDFIQLIAALTSLLASLLAIIG